MPKQLSAADVTVHAGPESARGRARGSREGLMARLRVVLVEDGSFAPGSLRPILESLDADVVVEGADWPGAVDQADARSGDLFVVALGNDPRLVYQMSPGDRAVIVVGEDFGDLSVAPAIEHGAYGFVPYPVDGALFHAQARAAVRRAAEAARARNELADVRDQL